MIDIASIILVGPPFTFEESAEQSGQWCVCSFDVFVPGVVLVNGEPAAQDFAAGVVVASHFIPGAVAGQGGCGC